jgi:hypothetical protein
MMMMMNDDDDDDDDKCSVSSDVCDNEDVTGVRPLSSHSKKIQYS